MKKILIIMALVLVISGCSSKTPITSKVDNGSDVVATVNGINVTKQDIYTTLLASSGANLVIDHSLQIIANQLITDEETINAKVEETIASYISMLGSEDSFNTYVKNSGYDTVDEFKEAQIIPSIKITLLVKQYIEENFTDLANEYGYSYIQSFKVDTESEALELISKINSGELTFEDVAKEKMGSGTVANVLCYTNASTTSVDSNIASRATSFTTIGLYATPIATSDSKYAVINVVDTDREAHKDEIVTSLLGISNVNTKAQAYFLSQNNFEVYEKGLAEDIKAVNEDYLK